MVLHIYLMGKHHKESGYILMYKSYMWFIVGCKLKYWSPYLMSFFSQKPLRWTFFLVFQGERLSHAVGCAFAACLERKQKREKECGVTATFDANRTTFTREGSFRVTTATEAAEREEVMRQLQDAKKSLCSECGSSARNTNIQIKLSI